MRCLSAVIFFAFLQTGWQADTCPAMPASGKYPDKCNVAMDMILKTLNNSLLSKSTMWGVADQIGNYGVAWLKARGNCNVPTMCEIGNLIKNYTAGKVNALLDCVAKYDQKTAGQVAMDVPVVMTIIGANGFSLDEIGQSLICGLMECLKPLYTNEFIPKFQKWCPAPNKTTIQNNVCALIATNINQLPLVQKCFNSVKARTKVAVLQKLYDKYVPKYCNLYQYFRDNSLVACQTKSFLCGCNITISDVANNTNISG